MGGAASICSMAVHEREICSSVTLGLVARSLVVFEGGGRYRLLETIRSFVAEKLHSRGEAALMEERHCRYFFALSENRTPGELAGWLNRMQLETDNLRSALGWPLENHQELAAQGVLSLDNWWRWRSHMGEANPYLHTLLRSHAAQGPTRVRVPINNGWYNSDAVRRPPAP